MPNIVPIAQVPLRGHSAISRPPSTAVTMPSATTSQRAGPPPAAAAASSITPLNRQQEAEEEGEAQGALDREGQQADAPHQIEQGREAAKHLAALPFHAGESQQLGDAGGDRHAAQGDREQGRRHEGQGDRQDCCDQQQGSGDPAELGGGWSGHGEWSIEGALTVAAAVAGGVESPTGL